jgi:hypothetical protein
MSYHIGCETQKDPSIFAVLDDHEKLEGGATCHPRTRSYVGLPTVEHALVASMVYHLS